MATKAEILQAIRNARTAFKDAIYGKDVRQGLVDVADSVYDAVNQWGTLIDDTLTQEGEAADAKAVGEKIVQAGQYAGESILQAANRTDITSSDVKFAFLLDGSCKVSGTATALAYYNYYVDASRLPSYIVAGRTYQVEFGSQNVNFIIYKYSGSGTETAIFSSKGSGEVTIPSDYSGGLIIRLSVANGTTVDEVVNPMMYADLEHANKERTVADSLPFLTGTVNGALGTITDSDDYALDIDTTKLTNNSTIRVCGKNIFTLSNNPNNDWDSEQTRTDDAYGFGSIKFSYNKYREEFTISSVDGLQWDGNSSHSLTWALSSFDIIRFREDTLITVFGNCSEPVAYGDNCFLQINPTTSDANYPAMRDYGAGITFLAKANVQYGLRIAVMVNSKAPLFKTSAAGIKFRPMVVIGADKGEYEQFKGANITYTGSKGDKQLAKLKTDRYTITSGELTVTFNPAEGSIKVHSDTPTTSARIISYGAVDEAHTTINGVAWNSLFKLTANSNKTVNVYTGIPKEYGDSISMQYCDENGVGHVLYSDAMNLTLKSGYEHGFRYSVAKGFVGDAILTPVISSGVYALRSFHPITNYIVTSSAGVLPATYRKATQIKKNANAASFSAAFAKFPLPDIPLKPQAVFIDDDTSSLDYVTLYHDMMSDIGVRGNYAVMTRNLDNQAGLADKLLEYEDEGFGMLYHCDYQSGAQTEYFLPGATRNVAQVRANIAQGLRKMRNYGFTDYKYWVTPYGVNDEEIQTVAKEFGFKALLANAQHSIVTPNGNANRYSIPRSGITAEASDTIGVAIIKRLLDAAALTNGLVIITTHANTWTDSTLQNTARTRITELVQYAQNLGIEITSFQEAFADRLPIFYFAEMYGQIKGD